MAWAAGIHPLSRTKQQGRPARTFAVRRDLLHPARAEQSVEVEANGIGVHVEHVGDGGDAHRRIRRFQHPQDVLTATEGLLCWLDDAHSPELSALGRPAISSDSP